jgi:hypothetical protein
MKLPTTILHQYLCSGCWDVLCRHRLKGRHDEVKSLVAVILQTCLNMDTGTKHAIMTGWWRLDKILYQSFHPSRKMSRWPWCDIFHCIMHYMQQMKLHVSLMQLFNNRWLGIWLQMEISGLYMTSLHLARGNVQGS